jgi:hypothetical protein
LAKTRVEGRGEKRKNYEGRRKKEEGSRMKFAENDRSKIDL